MPGCCENHGRNPQRPKLDIVIGTVTEKLVERYAAADDDPSSAALLRELAAAIPYIHWWRNGRPGCKGRPLRQGRTPVPRSNRTTCRKAAASIRHVVPSGRTGRTGKWPSQYINDIPTWLSASWAAGHRRPARSTAGIF